MSRSALAARLALAVPILALAATAQHVIRDGNAVYRVGAIGTNQADSVDCDFTADPSVSDVLVENWWYYRVDGDPDERAFRDDGNMIPRFAGRHGELNWPNADGRGLFRAHMGFSLYRSSPTGARLYNRLTIFNTSGRTLRITLYHYADIEPCGVGVETAYGDRLAHAVLGGCSGQAVAVEHHFPDAYLVEARDDGECGILDPGPASLADSGLPFAGGDCTSAAEWTLVLPATTEFTVWTSIWHNPGGCPPPQIENYGFGRAGSVGMPQITSTLPVMGQTATVTVSNAVPNTAGILMFGFGRIEIPMGPLMIQILAGPRGFDFDSFVLAADATGTINFQIPLPGTNEFCLRPVNWQCFLLDPGIPGGVPFSQTGGLEWVMGR